MHFYSLYVDARFFDFCCSCSFGLTGGTFLRLRGSSTKMGSEDAGFSKYIESFGNVSLSWKLHICGRWKLFERQTVIDLGMFLIRQQHRLIL